MNSLYQLTRERAKGKTKLKRLASAPLALAILLAVAEGPASLYSAEHSLATPFVSREVPLDLLGLNNILSARSGPSGILWILGQNEVNRLVLLRLNSDRSLDSSFGNRGRILFEGNPGTERGQILTASESGLLLDLWRWVKAQDKEQVVTQVIRILPDGTRDPAFMIAPHLEGFNLHLEGSISLAATQPDGSTLLHYVENNQPHLVRLFPNGAVDETFSAWNGFLLQLETDGLGRIYMLTNPMEEQPPGFPSGRLIRLQADGSLDSSYHPKLPSIGFNTRMEVSADGTVRFPMLTGTNVSKVEINADGEVKSAIIGDAGPASNARQLIELGDGRALIEFTYFFSIGPGGRGSQRIELYQPDGNSTTVAAGVNWGISKDLSDLSIPGLWMVDSEALTHFEFSGEEAAIGIGATDLLVFESDPLVALIRNGDALQEAAVEFTWAPLNADGPQTAQMTRHTATFLRGDSRFLFDPGSLKVPGYNPPRQFELNLVSASGAELSAWRRTRVTVLDDDARGASILRIEPMPDGSGAVLSVLREGQHHFEIFVECSRSLPFGQESGSRLYFQILEGKRGTARYLRTDPEQTMFFRLID